MTAFAEWVAQLRADDTELRKGLRLSELAVEQSARRMQAGFDRIGMSAGRASHGMNELGRSSRAASQGFGIARQAAYAFGSTELMSGLLIADLAVDTVGLVTRFLKLENVFQIVKTAAKSVASAMASIALVGGTIAAGGLALAGAITAPFVGWDKAASTSMLRFLTDWWYGANAAAAATDALGKKLKAIEMSKASDRMKQLVAAGTELNRLQEDADVKSGARTSRSVDIDRARSQFGGRAPEIVDARIRAQRSDMEDLFARKAFVAGEEWFQRQQLEAAKVWDEYESKGKQALAELRSDDGFQGMFRSKDDFAGRMENAISLDRDFRLRSQEARDEKNPILASIRKNRAFAESGAAGQFDVQAGSASSIRFAGPNTGSFVEGQNTVKREIEKTNELLEILNRHEQEILNILKIRRDGMGQ
jgi:hypothetical protein